MRGLGDAGERRGQRLTEQRRLQRRQPLRHGEQAPTAMRAARDASVRHRLDHAGDHGDGDHEIAARAELEEVAARGRAAAGNEDRRDELVGAAGPSADSR